LQNRTNGGGTYPLLFHETLRGEPASLKTTLMGRSFESTTSPREHPEVRVIGTNAAEVVAALRAESGRGEIWRFGGGQLFSSLLTAGQVDTVEVTVVPVLLGGGVPLVAGGIERTGLRLCRTHKYPSGMVSLVYAVEPRAV
jgi:dihydrofolate reductase